MTINAIIQIKEQSTNQVIKIYSKAKSHNLLSGCRVSHKSALPSGLVISLTLELNIANDTIAGRFSTRLNNQSNILTTFTDLPSKHLSEKVNWNSIILPLNLGSIDIDTNIEI